MGTHICCGHMAAWIKMSLGVDLGLAPGDFVLDGDPVLPSPIRDRPPLQFSTHFYCDQTAACIKMPLRMEVGLSPGDFVLHGDPAPPLNFRPMFIIVIVISLEHCTMQSRLVCSSSSSNFSILCILFLEKFNRTQSVRLCTFEPLNYSSVV